MKRLTPLLLLATVVAAIACNEDIVGLGPPSDPATETFAPTLNVDLAQMTKLPSGVYIRDLVPGTGTEIIDKTDSVRITYAGFLKDGKLFETRANAPFPMGGLVPGMRSGLQGMKEGGKRKLVIPSALGFGREIRDGPDGKTLIPRQSTLIFDVDLLKAFNPAPPATP